MNELEQELAAIREPFADPRYSDAFLGGIARHNHIPRLIAAVEAGQAHQLKGIDSDETSAEWSCSCGRGSEAFTTSQNRKLPYAVAADEFEAHRTAMQLAALRGEQQ